MELQKDIETIIDNTFKELNEISRNNGKSRLIFPNYNKGNIRISEQAFRFLFIEHLKPFLEAHNFYYSIETHTHDCYKFSKNKQQIMPQRKHNCTNTETEKYESAAFDLVIHRHEKDKNEERDALIEFKSKGTMHEYAKDICKLGNRYEGGDTTSRYFIIVVNNTGSNKGKTTAQSIQERFSKKNDQIDFESFKNDAEINIVCYSLELGKDKNQGKYIDLLSQLDTSLNLTTPEYIKKRIHEEK